MGSNWRCAQRLQWLQPSSSRAQWAWLGMGGGVPGDGVRRGRAVLGDATVGLRDGKCGVLPGLYKGRCKGGTCPARPYHYAQCDVMAPHAANTRRSS